MVTEQLVDGFLSNHNYDVRISKNGRWIDQKCTPDIVSIICDCILNYLTDNDVIDTNIEFSSTDIWNSEFSKEVVLDVFRKPELDNPSVKHEYDKFFQQPLELLAHANILSKTKKGRGNFYKVINVDMVKFISIRERNALVFLVKYIEKVLLDSGLLTEFERFFQKQDNSSYHHLKNTFYEFTKQNTKINGETESNRIFTKVINPLAYSKRSRGTSRGRLSPNKITLDMLMYNQENFRDVYASKPKEVSRQEFNVTRVLSPYSEYLINRAKRNVKNYNDVYNSGQSEVKDGVHDSDLATHHHHIFMKTEFPEIAHYEENIIALTPTQHLNYAHPNGNTQIIVSEYQHICLLAKTGTIEQSIRNEQTVYDFSNFKLVLETGHEDSSYADIAENDFERLVQMINTYYNMIGA